MPTPASSERATRAQLAWRLAHSRGSTSGASTTRPAAIPRRSTSCPSDTLVGVEAARALGIGGEHDLFGGVVPHPFVATKAITHPLVAPDAAAPAGWSPRVRATRSATAVLAGFSAFTPRRRAPRRPAPARARAACASSRCGPRGGRGQQVVRRRRASWGAHSRRWTPRELATARPRAGGEPGRGDDLQRRPGARGRPGGELLRHAAADAGQPRATRSTAAPTSWSRAAASRRCSALELAAGGPAARWRRRAPTTRPATACFPGFFASRRNYDVAQGLDSAGRWRSGVLEQSWRIGGASGAEIAALEAFGARARRCACVQASSVEIYGDGLRAAAGRDGLFQRRRRQRRAASPSTAVVERDADAR